MFSDAGEGSTATERRMITLSCSLLCFMETRIFPSVNSVIETAKSYYRLRRDTLHVFLDTGLLNYPPYCTRIRW